MERRLEEQQADRTETADKAEVCRDVSWNPEDPTDIILARVRSVRDAEVVAGAIVHTEEEVCSPPDWEPIFATPDRLSSAADRGALHIALARSDTSPSGEPIHRHFVAVALVCPTSSLLEHLYVLPQVRCLGVATAVLDELIEGPFPNLWASKIRDMAPIANPHDAAIRKLLSTKDLLHWPRCAAGAA